MASLNRFAECESSLFISYAHADDELNNGWISHFASELKRDLEAALAREDKGRDEMPLVYLSKYTGPVAGDLALQLRARVIRSFAMIIVVDEKYATSDWCLRELAYFHEAFGADGLDQRLTIVALRENPMRQVRCRPQWQQWFAGRDPIYRPFFDPDDLRSGPVPVLRDDVPGMTNKMFALYQPVRDDLVAKIRADLTRAAPARLPPRWVIGACRPELVAQVRGLAQQLAEKEPRIALVPTDALLSNRTLKALLGPAEALILPFNGGQPINDAIPGGHLAQQLGAWHSLNKPDDAVLLLDGSDTAAPEPADACHLQFLQDCALPKLTPDQVLERLAPRAPDETEGSPRRPTQQVKVFIESNRTEPDAWKKLGAQVRERWNKLLQANPVDARLSLRTNGFDFEMIDDMAIDEANGVILLWGQKDRRSLLSQINRVEDIFVEPAPAIVAHLSPPQPRSAQRMPAMQWDVLRFFGSEIPPSLLLPDSGDEVTLDAFVRDVLANTLRRRGLSAPT